MDKELDDLLDSALNDFDKKPNKSSQSTVESKITIEKTNLYVDDIDYEDRPVRKTMPDLKPANETQTKQQTSSFDDNMKLFDEIFNDAKAKESMKQFQAAFEMLQTGRNDTKVLEDFQKLMTDFASTNLGDDDEDDDDDFDKLSGFEMFKNLTKKDPVESTSTNDNANKTIQTEQSNEKPNALKKVLDEMNKSSEKVLKNSSFSGANDLFSSLLKSLNDNDEASSSGDENLDSASSLMMQPILSMLFSKEILYPSLKLMSENYDKYIIDMKDKLNEEELKKCMFQKECIKEMCKVYEDSKDTDTQETKTVQLKQILDWLEKCGMPPSELVPEVNPFEALGDQFKGNNSCPIS